MNRPEGQPGWPPEAGHADERAGGQWHGGEADERWAPGPSADQQYGPAGDQRQQYAYGGPAGGQQGEHGGPGGPWRGGSGSRWGGPGQPVSPVSEIDTRVTGRRVVQYIIDYIITGVVASVILWALDRGHGVGNAVLVLVGAVLAAAWYFWYWVYRPYRANGQSFGMQMLSLRVISKDGGRASMMQLLIRAILLIVDTFFWGLVGLITMVCSRYRQRVGDHAAKTLVVRAEVQPQQAERQYAGAGHAGYR